MLNLSAVIYALASLVLARLMFYERILDPLSKRIWLTWICLAPCTLLLAPGFLYFTTCATVLFFAKPNTSTDKVIYYVSILPTVLDIAEYDIPFPGLDRLITLTHWKLAALVLLLPLIFRKAGQNIKDRISAIDIAMYIYVIYISLLSIRELPLTSMLRVFIDNSLLILLPYFVISRFLYSGEHISKLMKNYYYITIILVAIGILTSFAKWDFYRIHNFLQLYDFRNNLLRINLTMNTASLATTMSFCVVIVEYFNLLKKRGSSQTIKLGALRLWGARGLLFFIVFATGNRGGLIQFAATIVIFYALFLFSRNTRKLLFWVATFFVIVGVALLPSLDFDGFDEHGTFEYRFNVFQASLVQLSQKPLFGEMYYLNDGNFSHLVQGEGIVDIVNWYLQIVLEFGVIGLGLFLFIYFGTIGKLYKIFNDPRTSEEIKIIAGIVISAFVPYMIVIGTTSNESMLPLQGIIFLALGRACINIAIAKSDLNSGQSTGTRSPSRDFNKFPTN